MRIGIEAFRIFRKEKHGIDIAAIELIRQLQKVDHVNEYYIFCIDGNDDSLLHETNNFRFVRIPPVPLPVAEQVILPYLCLKHKIDLLHSTGNTAPLIAFCKQVITLHDIIYLEPDNKSNQGARHQILGNYYRKLIVPFALKKAEKVVTVSWFEYHRILSYLPQLSDKLEVNLNGVGSHFCIKPEASMLNTQARYNLPRSGFLFIQGNSDPKKNLSTVLKSLQLLKEQGRLHFDVIMSDVTIGHLNTTLKSLGIQELSKHIKLTSYISNTDLPDVYNSATAFLYSSLRESFGIPILEAMACGTPVITSNCTSMPEIAGDAALLVDPNSAESIAAGIHKMMSDASLREEYRQKGLNRRKQFSWSRSARKMVEIYLDHDKSAMAQSVPN